MTALRDLVTASVGTAGGFPRLVCELAPANVGSAAAALAKAIARRRIGRNSRLHNVWTSHHSGTAAHQVAESDLRLFESGLLQNVGTPAASADKRHLYGLVAEFVWREAIEVNDVGLGLPERVEGPDWSVTDRGGDGLTVYATATGFCFRLWESKYHGTDAPLRVTANFACRQLVRRSLSYLSRFSAVAQYLPDNEQLASFYGRLPELWVNKDPRAGVGITLTANCDVDTNGDFDNVTAYFDLDCSQHQAVLHLVGDVPHFAEAVRNNLWKGCGLWTAP